MVPRIGLVVVVLLLTGSLAAAQIFKGGGARGPQGGPRVQPTVGPAGYPTISPTTSTFSPGTPTFGTTPQPDGGSTWGDQSSPDGGSAAAGGLPDESVYALLRQVRGIDAVVDRLPLVIKHREIEAGQ